MKDPISMKHKLWNLPLRLTMRYGLESIIARQAPREEFSAIDLEIQGLQHGYRLKNWLTFSEDNNVAQEYLGLESPIPGQDDPFLLLGHPNKTMEVFAREDSGVKTEASEPLGKLPHGHIKDESFFHSTGSPV